MEKYNYGAVQNFIVRGSFAAGICATHSFGTLRVPNRFVEEFGSNLPKDMCLTCKGGMGWGAQYDVEKKQISGLEQFMLCHNVKQMYTVLLDYLGDGNFDIHIYNSSGLEVNSSRCVEGKCRNSTVAIKDSEYILGLDHLEDEKARSRYFASVYSRKLRYFDLIIDETNIPPAMHKLMLPKRMFELYRNWKNGDTIKLYFLIKYWEVRIEIVGNDCYLGSGWNTFVEESGVQKNDILVFNAVFEQSQDMVHVCVFQIDDIRSFEMRLGKEKCTVSFFHVLNQYTWLYKEIVPPIIVRKLYDGILAKVDTLRCGESIFPISYQTDSQSMVNIEQILKEYDLSRNDTFFITITGDREAKMRIYRKDGMEVEYESRSPAPKINLEHWFMNYTWEEEKSVELSEGVEEADDRDGDFVQAIPENHIPEFISTLCRSNVDKRCHGVYIGRDLYPFVGDWISGKRVFFRRNAQNWNIGINKTNGRIRFSAGWNKFVRDNRLKENDEVVFRLQADVVTFDVKFVVH